MVATPKVDYSGIAVNPEVVWPKKAGRPKKGLDPNLVQALHHSFANESVTVSVVIRSDQEGRVRSQFQRATKELNMRIERLFQKDTPQEGFTTVHFRAKIKTYNRRID